MNKSYKEKKWWSRWRQVVNVLACIAVFITTYALILPAITMEQTIYCEQEEHEHTEECYRTEEVLICETPMHVHSDECYIDRTVDKETKDVWEASVAGVQLTGDLHEDLVHVAETQLGYAESTVNYTVENGENRGYTRYGEWYGEPYAEWSGMFASFCMHYAKTELPEAKDSTELKNAFAAMGLYVSAGNYEPVKGDVVFLDTDHDGALDHTGIIKNTEDELQIIVGDYEDKVSLLSYEKNDVSIKGYGLLKPEELADVIIEEENDDAETAVSEMNKAEDVFFAGTVSALSSNKMPKANAMLLSNTAPIDVSGYIIAQNDDGAKTQLLYKVGNGAWQPVNGNVEIPGDATLHLDVVYAGVNVDALIAAGNQLTYDVPDFMRNPVTQGAIMSGSTQVGTIVVENGKAIITFYQEFLNQQKANNKTELSGTFYIESEINKSYVDEKMPDKLQIGDVTINLAWEDEIVAKTANIRIDKNLVSTVVEEAADGNYLTYTIKVTNGEDAVTDIKIVDKYTDKTYVESYVGVTGTSRAITSVAGVTETGAPGGKGGSVYLGTVTTGADSKTTITPAGANAAKPGTMIWAIGDMAPYEERTLTYKVKVNDSYVGYSAKNALVNDATVYSKGYKHDHDPVTFTPKATGKVSKSRSGTPKTNADGSITINYVVTITADATNSYVIKNAGWKDSLQNGSAKDVIKYAHYDHDSFELYDVVNGKEIRNTTVQPTVTFTENATANAFEYSFGELKPGESKKLRYSVTVDRDIFAVNGNSGILVSNTLTGGIFEGTNGSLGPFGTSNVQTGIGSKRWDRKMTGGRVEQATNISMSGSVYDATGSSVTSVRYPSRSFTVPEGSYKYVVIANEAGDWNISSASLKDSFDQNYMKFVGYVQVDAFEINEDAPATSLSDEQAEAFFADKTPKKTVWVKVDGNGSFSFKPNEIGLNGEYAYRLTYYAKPVSWDGKPVTISNKFGIGGIIGTDGKVIPDIIAKADVVISNVESSEMEKKAWYYDENKDSNFVNGKLMWALTFAGDKVSNGFRFEESTSEENLSKPPFTSYMLYGTESILGVYKGKKDITQYDSLEAAVESGAFTAVDKSCIKMILQGESAHYYENGKSYYFRIKYEFTKDIPLEDGEKLYVVFATIPWKTPTKTETMEYKNKLSYFNPSTNEWELTNEAKQTLSGNEGIAKTAAAIHTVTNNKDVKSVSMDGVFHGDEFGISFPYNSALGYEYKPNGTYLDWTIHINMDGEYNGQSIDIEELIPEGLELAVFRVRGYTASDNSTPKEYTATVPEWEQNGWVKRSQGAYTANRNPAVGSGVRVTAISYVKDDKVRCRLQNLEGPLELMVACRVTDPDVIMGEQEKTFINTVNLYNSQGDKVDDDSSPITVKKVSLNKNTVVEEEYLGEFGGMVPFIIFVNINDEDLIKGADTVTVVDTMSPSLKFNMSSVNIWDMAEGEELDSSQYSVQVEGQTVKFIVPDDRHLRIYYEATVQAPPGEMVDITNDAHWEGYAPGDNTTVEIKNFSYSAGGTVSTSDTPYLTIVKRDQYNANTLLPGAKFKVTEVKLANNQFQLKSGGQVWDSADMVTGADGTLTVGRESSKLMKWNTVYMIEETEAPAGYVLDAEPHYFAVAKMVSGKYPSELETFRAAGATIYYLDAEYTYTAYNHRCEASVVKKFHDASGNDQVKLDGTYRFGICEVTGGVESDILQIQTLQIRNGSENGTVTFTNLAKDKTYRIYELDDNDHKIANGELGTVGGKLFDVTYDHDENTVTFAGDTEPVVTVTNSVHYTELPQTGGIGTKLYTITGIMMMLVSAGFLLMKRH